MLEAFDEVMAIMLPTLGPERRATYSPFLPISPNSGRVLQVPTLERQPKKGTIVFSTRDTGKTSRCRSPAAREVPVEGRLGAALDGARRRLRDVGQGPHRFGHAVLAASARRSAATPPEGFNYELFLDDKGQKISKSKGNGLTIEEWLRYASAGEPVAVHVPEAEVGEAALLRRHPARGR